MGPASLLRLISRALAGNSNEMGHIHAADPALATGNPPRDGAGRLTWDRTHSRIATTFRYHHVSRTDVTATKSPLDLLKR